MAEADKVWKLIDIDHTFRSKALDPVTIIPYIPTNNSNWHAWKFLRFGPDGLLYVPVGYVPFHCFCCCLGLQIAPDPLD